MKKLTITVAVMSIMLLLVACGSNGTKESPAETPAESPQEEAAKEPAEAPEQAESPSEAPVIEEEAEKLTVDRLYPFETDTYRVYEGK